MGLPIVRIGALKDVVVLDRLFSKSRHFVGFGQIQVSTQGIGIQLQLSCVLDHRLLELSLVDQDISKIVVDHGLVWIEFICAIQQALRFITWAYLHGDALARQARFVPLPDKVQAMVSREVAKDLTNEPTPALWRRLSPIVRPTF